ncbi:MAG TPA: PDZ domain-containing protein [Gemmatimonadales bacterium]|nr:PDZ domain-containing protein [Gemmatimonadales bacterium]
MTAWPAAATAQERRPESRPRIYVKGDSTLVRDRIKLVTQRRARLGISVDLREVDADSGGARIMTVTPGGPASKAGIKSGDVITKLGEKQVGSGMHLVEIAAQLKPNETISVEYKREGVRKTTSLVTGDEPMMEFEYPEWTGRGVMFPKLEFERAMPRSGGATFEFGPGASGFAYAFGGPLMKLELAPLNADLGQYFGTTEGVLVIDVPKESSLGVKGGDVILSVDGRKASGPGSLLRILRSYEPGDSFKLEIMRNKSRMTVTGKLEKRKEE